jgi:hypothetical protein
LEGDSGHSRRLRLLLLRRFWNILIAKDGLPNVAEAVQRVKE